MKTSLDEQEYNRRVCEEDAEWKAYCKFPSDENWKLYVEAKEETKLALRKWYGLESTMLTEKEPMTR